LTPLNKSRLPQAVLLQRLEPNNYAYFGAIPVWAIATLYILPTQFLAGISLGHFALYFSASACSLSFWTLQT
jgi:hypothetical protein